jgi:hypothetical protein
LRTRVPARAEEMCLRRRPLSGACRSESRTSGGTTVSGVREVHNQLRVSQGSRDQETENAARPGEPPRYRVA